MAAGRGNRYVGEKKFTGGAHETNDWIAGFQWKTFAVVSEAYQDPAAVKRQCEPLNGAWLRQ